VLAHAAVDRRRLRVLLAANKADCGARAHTADFIRKRLEKALGELRGTRGTLGSTDGGAGGKARASPVRCLAFNAWHGMRRALSARLAAIMRCSSSASVVAWDARWYHIDG
jgi:hypothetical protein